MSKGSLQSVLGPLNDSRRRLAGAAAVALAALRPRPASAQTAASAAAGRQDASPADPGPENKLLAAISPDSVDPPPTDHGSAPNFWHSFSLAHRRVQEGGWSRQVNVEDFPISREIAGVNMKLNAGGVRELHWHAADEWSLMLTGACRLTAFDFDGLPYVQDVAAGDLWYFPTGIPHSIQGLGPEGCEFLLVFDDGTFSEDNTTLISDWAIHTPKDVLARNWRAPVPALAPLEEIPPEGRYIFQAAIPGPLAADRAAVSTTRPLTRTAFEFHMSRMKPRIETPTGEIRVVDSGNFPVAANIAMAHVALKPGGLRELHWHPDADEWQYFIAGKGRMTLFHNKATARTMDFAAGDVGYVPRTLGHYIQNTGADDLVFLEMFKAPRYRDFSLNDWMTHAPPELIAQHLGLSPQTLAAIPHANSGAL